MAFESEADNLSDEDGGFEDVFVRDVQTNTTTLVSRASGAAGAKGDAQSHSPSISADGRFVAFVSLANNLSAEDADSVFDVFVRDLETDTTILVSRAGGAASTAADYHSSRPAISGDGRFVAFESDADNLSAEDSDTFRDVFVRDLQTSTTFYVSRASGAAGAAGDHESFTASISADGRFVAFSSFADGLSREDEDTALNVFVRDLQTETTTYASRASGPTGAAADDSSGDPSLSGDGRFVAFSSLADNLSGDDNDAASDIFVRDLQANRTTYVSRASGAAGAAAGGGSARPSVSADGRFVAFDSLANNLSSADNDAVPDIFVRDLLAGTTTYLSRASGAAGAAGDGSSMRPSIDADGAFVAFQSEANSLSSEDNDAFANVFMRHVGGPSLAPAPLPRPPPAPAPAPNPAGAADITGPAITGSALARRNGTIRVSRSGRFRLFCGQYAEPVTGSCSARSVRPVRVPNRTARARHVWRKRTLRASPRSYRAGPGRPVMLGFRLSRSSLRALGAAKQVPMRGTVIAHDVAGNATTVRFRFSLRARKPTTRR